MKPETKLASLTGLFFSSCHYFFFFLAAPSSRIGWKVQNAAACEERLLGVCSELHPWDPAFVRGETAYSVRALTEDFLENPSLRACLPPALVTNPLIGTNPNKRFMETRKINE